MTENELRQQMLDQAKRWLDCKESDGSHKQIIDCYNTITPRPRGYRMSYSDPWCATFVSAVAQMCGLTDIVFPECGCEPMIKLYKAAGRWIEDDAYSPKPGDVIFYDWQDSGAGDCTGGADHVGLVWYSYVDDITIIEGNKSDSVSFRDIKRNGRYIRGYGVPDYASKATAEEPTPTPEPEPEPEKTCQITLPILMIGDDGEAVRTLQIMLEKRGFKCGWTGADGEFGPKTESALGKFQGAYELEKDGICKGIDWTVLIVGVKKYE